LCDCEQKFTHLLVYHVAAKNKSWGGAKLYKVFVEYTILQEMRLIYLNHMREWLKREGRLELLEGSDQPGLFVEIWNDVPYEEYEELKKQRLQISDENDRLWGNWVQGGLAKINIWHFTGITV
jgi:hypothetical protein